MTNHITKQLSQLKLKKCDQLLKGEIAATCKLKKKSLMFRIATDHTPKFGKSEVPKTINKSLRISL